eukprot:11763-Eustigmatos_ZCMA.PRE.1
MQQQGWRQWIRKVSQRRCWCPCRGSRRFQRSTPTRSGEPDMAVCPQNVPAIYGPVCTANDPYARHHAPGRVERQRT